MKPLNVGVNEFTGTLPLYLVPSAPEFDNLRRDLPPSVRYVGPCLCNRSPDQPPPAWLAQIPRYRPLVAVDEGALFTAEPRLLRMAVRGLADLPLTVVLLAGEGRDLTRLDLGRLASNVVVQAHTALPDVLPRADVWVTNGNSESVLAALQSGLPVVVLPSIWDQAEMAWRLQETGVGLRVSPWHATAQKLGQAVNRVLAEPSFRRNAGAMGVALTRYGGAARAVSLLEEVVNPVSVDRR